MRAEVRKDGMTTKIFDKVSTVEDRGGAYEIKFWDKPSAYVFKNAADSVNVVQNESGNVYGRTRSV